MAQGSSQREVKLVLGPKGHELFIPARSTDRRHKEHAMRQRFIDCMEAVLQKMQGSAASGQLKDPQLAYQRPGRIQQRYPYDGFVLLPSSRSPMKLISFGICITKKLVSLIAV